MTTTQTAPAAARRIWNPAQRDAATFLETAAESGGRRTLLEVELERGGGNELHRHLTYDERFEVLEGRLAVTVGDAVLALAPGDTVTAPAGAAHRFGNPTDGRVRFRVELRPGHAGFERALQVAYGLAADGRSRRDGTPRNLFHLALLVTWSEIALVGPERALAPAFGLLAAVARRRGVERELTERYVRV